MLPIEMISAPEHTSMGKQLFGMHAAPLVQVKEQLASKVMEQAVPLQHAPVAGQATDGGQEASPRKMLGLAQARGITTEHAPVWSQHAPGVQGVPEQVWPTPRKVPVHDD